MYVLSFTPQNNSLQEWSFKKAITIKSYSISYHPVPVPFNLVSIPVLALWRLCRCSVTERHGFNEDTLDETEMVSPVTFNGFKDYIFVCFCFNFFKQSSVLCSVNEIKFLTVNTMDLTYRINMRVKGRDPLGQNFRLGKKDNLQKLSKIFENCRSIRLCTGISGNFG